MSVTLEHPVPSALLAATPVVPPVAANGNLRFDFPQNAAELLRSCVHCGLCLGACPTYRELGNENDSPRGRLYIMRGLSDGTVAPEPHITKHLDLCLDCRACETACPSGVQYGQILEGTREALVLARPPGLLARILKTFFFEQIFPRPEILSLITRAVRFQQRSGLRAFAKRIGIMKLLPRRLRELEEMQPEIKEQAFLENAPEFFPAEGGPAKQRIAFFAGCVMDQFMGDIHRATIKVLQAHGVEILSVPGQVCCGALMVHAGDGNTARMLARRNLSIFHGLDVSAIVNNSAGCGAQLKDYHHLLPGDAEAQKFASRVKDVSEILAPLQPVRPLKPLNKSVCYDPPCHLMHAQRITAPPVTILQRIPGIKWVALPDAEFCCGAAGIYNLTQPDMSQRVLARKVEAIASTGAEIVVTGNPGCLMQIRNGCKAAGLKCEVLHPMELIARQL